MSEWFGRTVIRSCAKLAYEHAQSMLEQPGREFIEGELPPVTGGYTAKDLSTKVATPPLDFLPWICLTLTL